MPSLIIALKDLRLLARDARSAVILLLMPLLLVLVLGLSLGTLFERKPDDRIRISVVNADAGLPPGGSQAFPPGPWADRVVADLTDTADIRVEVIPDRAEAERLVRAGERAAVVVFRPEFSDRVDRCSFVGEPFRLAPINPLYRDGMRTDELGVTVLQNPGQPVAAAVIRQVIQVTLMRVVIPWMIGQAFEQIGTPEFMTRMEKHIPGMGLMPGAFKENLGKGIQKGIGAFFSNYRFTAKTWSGLTNSQPPPARSENRSAYEAPDGGPLGIDRGAVRYQTLVPSYTVTFAFFLVLTVGWLFVAERRHGTLVRLRAAPLARWQILVGKLVPCLVVSLLQGFLLLGCGKVVFGMSWGPRPDLLVPVVVCTSLAAVGLALVVAGTARTEAQVAVYGTLLVLALAGVSGSLMPRDLMPEGMRQLSRVTPHAWALDAYAQLLASPDPQVGAVWRACGVLAGFGAGFSLLAWWRLRLD